MKKIFHSFLLLLGVLTLGFVLFRSVYHAHAQTAATIPTGLTVASTTSPYQASLSWTAPTVGSSTVIAGYYIYRNGAQIAATPGTTFVDSGLSQGFYTYAVAMYDANGNVYPRSAAVSFSVVLDTIPPSAPTGVTVTGATSTNSGLAQIPITISWNASTDNVGVAGYYVYRNGTLIVSSTPNFTATTLTDTVNPGTYAYTVAAYDAAQNISSRSAPVSISIQIDNTAPSIPTKLVAQQTSENTVNLSWASSTDNVGVTGYEVFRNGVQIASTTGASYTDTGLSPAVNYSYAVAAYDAAGNVSDQSQSFPIILQITNGPGVPSFLVAALSGSSSVLLSWVPGGDTLPISTFTIYRNGNEIASVSGTPYLDTGLAAGIYGYSVSETDMSGAVSSSTATTTITVPAFVPGAVSTPVAIISTPTTNVQSSATATSKATLTQFLYLGLRSLQVKELQSILITSGYLPSEDGTGYFGSLTLRAVQKFQCDEKVVCTGGAGYGTVGPKTRAALNSL
jgi:chitodextrinase